MPVPAIGAERTMPSNAGVVSPPATTTCEEPEIANAKGSTAKYTLMQRARKGSSTALVKSVLPETPVRRFEELSEKKLISSEKSSSSCASVRGSWYSRIANTTFGTFTRSHWRAASRSSVGCDTPKRAWTAGEGLPKMRALVAMIV